MTSAARPGTPEREPRASLSLLDFRRRVSDLYSKVRAATPVDGHRLWVAERDDLFRNHSQSPIPVERRASFDGLSLWPYDETLRFDLTVEATTDESTVGLPHSGVGATRGRAVGVVTVPLGRTGIELTVFRLDQYGDGLFLPFVDGTAGSASYGGGRYLIDTAKGADLGSTDSTIVVDFNFAYHPSCVHDSRWSCPLAPASNRFDHPIRAGERLGGTI